MKYLRFSLSIFQAFLLSSTSLLIAAEQNALTEAQFTEIVNMVTVTNVTNSSEHQAQLEETFQKPNLVSTGRRSRAELKAADDTVIRLGSSTTFSFSKDQRSIKLDEGSLLFHSPTGRGGGRIETATATATVIGTTIVVIVAPDGSFKLLVLEGDAKVIFIDGTVRTLTAGQLVFIKASVGGKKGRPSKVMNFDLQSLTNGSLLINGFKHPLASHSKIQHCIEQQKHMQSSSEKQKSSLKLAPPPDGKSSNDINRRKQSIHQAPTINRGPNEGGSFPPDREG
ncbi:MAG: FecR domain-containing protein [Opitutaceae bacterium]